MTFEDFSLSRETMLAVSEMGFEEPTPIQVSTIPLILRGKDIIGQAQTGTGKTAAFGIPMIEKCKGGKNPCALILEPTRELAVQVAQELNKLGKYKMVDVLPVYGGKSIDNQIRSLKRGVDIIVGTPGRIIDHITRKTISLSDIKVVVLDEADEMLNMGFVEDIEFILGATPSERQTLLFSATMPQPIMGIAKKYMMTPETVRMSTEELVIPKIRQIFYEVREGEKIHALSRLLDTEEPGLAIIFCHTKREVDGVSQQLGQMGYNAGALHGDFTQSRRDEVMSKLKGGLLDILVATDVAARGLDIRNVTHVINYSIPQNPESYVHRIGRTGRAGKSGIAITLVTPREYRHLRQIERIAKTTINRKKLPSEQDATDARERNVVKDIGGIINDNKHLPYMSVLKTLVNQYSLNDLAAAALYAAYGEMKEMPVGGQDGRQGTVRLFMTIGRKDRIRVADIVRSVASEANIPHSKIGEIRVLDRFTFIEVPEELADRIIRSVDDIGKRVRIQQARSDSSTGKKWRG